MEYIVIKRTKLYKANDLISIEKTAKTLDDAVKFKVALEMLAYFDRYSRCLQLSYDRTSRRKTR